MIGIAFIELILYFSIGWYLIYNYLHAILDNTFNICSNIIPVAVEVNTSCFSFNTLVIIIILAHGLMPVYGKLRTSSIWQPFSSSESINFSSRYTTTMHPVSQKNNPSFVTSIYSWVGWNSYVLTNFSQLSTSFPPTGIKYGLPDWQLWPLIYLTIANKYNYIPCFKTLSQV